MTIGAQTQAQTRLDDEIAALTLVLSNLRTQRNTFSPISRLPPEILASIFIRCARSHRPDGCQGYGRLPDWIKVSYVCRHWRDVALNCSTLWSFLFVSSQHWTNELLSRSKTAPLKVRVDSEYPKGSRELNLLRGVAPQADRIQDLSLWLTRQEADRILSWFSSPAPLLQSLRISVERSNYLNEPTLVSEALFDGDTPALRKLELMNITFPLTSPTLRGLTFLRLRGLGTSFQPTLAELKVALSRMQDLAHLHLENALPSARGNSTGQSFEGSEKLSFPRLSRLSVVAPFSTVVLLLSCFDLPIHTEIRLRCCFEAGVEDYTPIYPLLAKRFIAHQEFALVPTIRTSFIEAASATVGFIFSTADRDSGIDAIRERVLQSRAATLEHFDECFKNQIKNTGWRTFSGSTTSYDLGQLCEDWDCNIPLKVDIVLRTSLSKDREDLIGGICDSMPLANLQSFHFSLDMKTMLSSAFWIKTFGHLQELQHIKLSGVDLQGLVRVLSLAPHHHPKNEGKNLESSSGQVFFAPALEELELYNVDFSNKCYGRRQGNPDDCSCSVPCLYDALSGRRAEGHGLRRLVLAKCIYVHGYDVQDLRSSIRDVRWDGVTRTIPHSENAEDEEEGVEDEAPHGHIY